nr:MAG TPA_asm: hypothetical protein [Caudoviricetes sp.]
MAKGKFCDITTSKSNVGLSIHISLHLPGA